MADNAQQAFSDVSSRLNALESSGGGTSGETIKRVDNMGWFTPTDPWDWGCTESGIYTFPISRNTEGGPDSSQNFQCYMVASIGTGQEAYYVTAYGSDGKGVYENIYRAGAWTGWYPKGFYVPEYTIGSNSSYGGPKPIVGKLAKWTISVANGSIWRPIGGAGYNSATTPIMFFDGGNAGTGFSLCGDEYMVHNVICNISSAGYDYSVRGHLGSAYNWQDADLANYTAVFDFPSFGSSPGSVNWWVVAGRATADFSLGFTVWYTLLKHPRYVTI